MRRLLLLLPILLLAACDNLMLQTQSYTLTPPSTPQGQRCAKQCPVAKAQCMRNCEATKNTCLHAAQLGAQQTYLQYVNERMAQGLLVDKKESDFLTDPRNCPSLEACQQGCDINLRTCHGNCGGTVSQNGHCLANCDAAPKSTLGELGDWFGENPNN